MLRDSMASESLKTLVGNLNTGGFQATWDELLRRFDNLKQLAELHVSRFVGIKPVSSETSAELLTVVDTVRESLRAPRVMRLPVDQWDELSVPIVTSKLPQTTQHPWGWGMHTDQKKIQTLEELLAELLRKESLFGCTSLARHIRKEHFIATRWVPIRNQYTRETIQIELGGNST